MAIKIKLVEAEEPLYLLDLDGNPLVDKVKRDARGNVVYDEEGEPVPKTFSTVAKALAGILANSPHAGDKALKAYEMAKELSSAGELSVDSEDFDFLKGLVEKDTGYTPLARGQLLGLLRKAKVESEDAAAKVPAADPQIVK